MTTKSVRPLLLAMALAFAAATSDAQVQPYGGGSITLYDQPDFQGQSVTITQSAPNLSRWRFNDRAQSARIEGRWLICEHDDFRGRCQEVSGTVPNLHTLGLMAQVSSLAPAGRPRGDEDGNGGGYGGGPRTGRDARGIEGTRTVFFPRPSVDGLDVAAGDRGADTYCRRQGLGQAVFFDSNERARQAIGPDGELVGRSSVLRDLLCRRY